MLSSNTSAVSGDANYIEDVFSTYLYTGTGATQSINNGVDLAGKGGLVWIKRRDSIDVHALIDTARGANSWLGTERTLTPYSYSGFTSFNSNGFTLGAPVESSTINGSGRSLSSWTFRKQPKFFDVVTYSGNSVSGREIAHSLGSTPGCMIVKCTSASAGWFVWHRSMGGNNYIQYLNNTDPRVNGGAPFWNNTAPTSTVFTVGNDSDINQTGRTYVAYLFAHDAGGFGLTGTDNVISCGSFTTDGSGAATMTLGYEPQWITIKNSSSAEDWITIDNMRGWTNGAGGEAVLSPNLSSAEAAGNYGNLTSTGATWANLSASKTYIYIAIRRGPMKVPTDGTKVFLPNTVSSDASAQTTNFPVDMFLTNKRAGNALNTIAVSKLTSNSGLVTSSTAAEAANYASATWWQSNTSYTAGVWGTASIVDYAFRRAPSFFDEVCYKGTGSLTTISHGLGVAPELMIVKRRDASAAWSIYTSVLGATKLYNGFGPGGPSTNPDWWNNTTPTASVFTVNTQAAINASGGTYVAYLFGSLAGVSKVGTYTGNGSSQTINCGFTSGARFVLIRPTTADGNWILFDSARGIVAGNDPYLLIGSTVAEDSADDGIDTDSSGFIVNELTNSGSVQKKINQSGVSYTYFAIA